jgi:putative peptidoglycan lipid II flippase
LNLIFNWIFTFQLGWGHRGLAFSTGCVATCNFIVLYWLMRRHLKRLETRRMLRMLVKVGLSGAGLAAICWASQHWLLSTWATQAFYLKVTYLLATIVIGALAFLGIGLAVRVEELNDLLLAVKRRLKRS